MAVGQEKDKKGRPNLIHNLDVASFIIRLSWNNDSIRPIPLTLPAAQGLLIFLLNPKHRKRLPFKTNWMKQSKTTTPGMEKILI